MKRFPQDKAATGALERIKSAGASWRRKKPLNRGFRAFWDSEKKKTVHRLEKVVDAIASESVITLAHLFHELPHPKRGVAVEATMRANKGQYIRIF